MAQRMVLGLRAGVGYGLWVSRPGQNVDGNTEAGLLFSMQRRHAMALASGSFVCPNGGAGIAISFGRTAPSVPLVFAGRLTQFPSTAPVRVVVNVNGFTAFARQTPDGDYPAGGVTCRWYAVLKNQD